MSTDERNRFERWAQMLFGFGLWAYMLYNDMAMDIALGSLTKQELAIMGVRYGFAGILILGVQTSEIAEIIRAWKSKN